MTIEFLSPKDGYSQGSRVTTLSSSKEAAYVAAGVARYALPTGPQVKTSATLTPGAVAANTTAEQTFSVPGLTAGELVLVNKPTAQAGLGIVGARVVSNDTLGITFSNNTAAAITPTAGETYSLALVR